MAARSEGGVVAASVTLSDPAHDAALRSDGLVVLGSVDATALAALRAVFATHSHRYAKGFTSTLQLEDAGHRRDVDAVLRELLEPFWSPRTHHYRALAHGFVCKGPGGGALRWHQDVRVTPLGSRPALSLWIPLVDVDRSTGTLEYVPGTHRYDGARPVGAPLAVPSEALALEPLSLPLRAGEAAIFHGALVHGSPANASSSLRPVATALLVPAEAPAQLWSLQRGQETAVEVPDLFFVDGSLQRIARIPH